MDENVSNIKGVNKNWNGISLLTAQEIAAMMQISDAMAYRLMQHGQIHIVKIGRSVRVRPIDLEVFITRAMAIG